MARGENIFKRKDGRWEARYIKGYELSGKIKYGFCYGKTYKEAKEKAAKYKAAICMGKPIAQAKERKQFQIYCDEWLAAIKHSVKESTYIKYGTMLDLHIKPKLGTCCPLGFTTEFIQKYMLELLEGEHLAPKTVKDIMVVLHSILKYTAKRFPGTFPIIEITYPKDNKKEKRVLSKEEQTNFMQYLFRDMDECKFGILLTLFTGIRIGEICALRWENISLEDKTIKINATMQRLKDIDADSTKKTRISISSPKSSQSLRMIPMSDFLAELCERRRSANPSAFVLTGTTDYMEPRVLQYRLKKYSSECGLEGVHFHSLRHTFATRCVEVGFEIKSLSEILGHANTTITLNCYVHSSMELKRSNMNKLSAMSW